jgi:hypothetical protein
LTRRQLTRGNAVSSQCPKCGIYGGATAAHECLPSNYVELERVTDEDIAIEREARLLGIHPFELVRRRHAEKKEAERLAAQAELDVLCDKWGMTP